ncbi:dnaj-like protein, partial [Thalassiosira pseudonana CCMP1335]
AIAATAKAGQYAVQGYNEYRASMIRLMKRLRRYYEGGFEEQMTRKEAALILGVRESSTPKRIKEAHRKLLILNHPDTGGSTYIAGKINEAKELLL